MQGEDKICQDLWSPEMIYDGKTGITGPFTLPHLGPGNRTVSRPQTAVFGLGSTRGNHGLQLTIPILWLFDYTQYVL